MSNAIFQQQNSRILDNLAFLRVFIRKNSQVLSNIVGLVGLEGVDTYFLGSPGASGAHYIVYM